MSSFSNTTTNVINPKPCNYNCGTRIYWNNEVLIRSNSV